MHEHNLQAISLNNVGKWRIGLRPLGADVKFTPSDAPTLLAEVPSLQRGLVWRAQQIELLWDSLARGLPLGSLLLVPRDGKSHEILDGQQRSHTVALGFDDPWLNGTDPQILKAILWWDIAAKPFELKDRSYLFRLTTKAHPWGFKDDANSSRLVHSDMRAVVERHNGRPSPKATLPCKARLPVPMGWLLARFYRESAPDWGTLLDEYRRWLEEKGLISKNPELMERLKTAGENFLDDFEQQQHIQNAIKRILDTYLPVIVVPQSVAENPSDLERLFQRFNRQGTQVSQEELQYAMLKSRWPEVRGYLEGINPLPTSDYRVARLAIRVALTDPGQRLHGDTNSEQVRRWFGGYNGLEREKIERYFTDELPRAIHWADQVLLYRKAQNSFDFGIPQFLRTTLTWNSPEVYALLLLLGRRLEYAEPPTPLRKKIIALALTLHWFAPKRPDAVSQISEHFSQDSAQASATILNDLRLSQFANESVLPPITPAGLEQLLRLHDEWTEEQLGKKTTANQWEFQHTFLLRHTTDEVSINNRDLYWRITHNTSSRELLLYRQRAYIEQNLDGFDPADRVYWEGHDRPWDYDHIHPQSWLDARGRELKRYTHVAKAFNQSIGNFVAVDLSYNRSASDSSPLKKYTLGERDSLHAAIDYELLEAASALELEDTDDLTKVVRFSKAVARRTLALYSHWFDELGVSSLLG